MRLQSQRSCTAFADHRMIASGDMLLVAAEIKDHLKKSPKSSILIFDDLTSRQVELDLRGTKEAVLTRLRQLWGSEQIEDTVKKPGRPKLGVVSKEVTLLPRHWEWLASQPGGASAVLRRLVEQAQKKNQARDEARMAQEAVYKFMTVIAGDMPNYEEALRAYYAKQKEHFTKLTEDWPADVRKHLLKLAKSQWT